MVQRSHNPANQIARPSVRANRCFTLEPLSPVHSYQALAGTRHRRLAKASRKVLALWQVSTLQLKVVSLNPSSAPFAVSFNGLPLRQKGTRPQRIFSSTKPPSSTRAV